MTDSLHFRAAIFDLDGVVTDTARLHAMAWKRLIDGYLEQRAARFGEDHLPFDPDQDYRRYVDGRPRYEGLRNFLLARGIELPFGAPSDAPGHETICGLANRKQEHFEQVLDNEAVDLVEGTVELIGALRARGVRVAVASSSRNCRRIVEGAGIAHLFEARVDGVTLGELGLEGKPDPAMFLEAARRVETPPSESVVFEDAVSGVEAGRKGGFGLVVGVAAERSARPGLRAAGADLLVEAENTGTLTAELLDRWFTGAEHRRPFALREWGRLRAEMGDRLPALFLDYDGTLTPIVDRPEDAALSPEVRGLLARLAERLPVTVVSGRARDDVAALVGLDELNYAGSHGFEITGPARGRGRPLRHEVAAEVVPVVDAATRELEERLAAVEGALVEPKRYTVAVHYRLVAPEEAAQVDRAVEEVVERHPELRAGGGKKVWELRPRLEWDKGKAVLWVIEALELDAPRFVPIYVGDDTTDEDAFAALRGSGIGIAVTDAPRPTAAGYAVQDPEEVRELLERMTQL